jgi:hypothetical protein
MEVTRNGERQMKSNEHRDRCLMLGNPGSHLSSETGYLELSFS